MVPIKEVANLSICDLQNHLACPLHNFLALFKMESIESPLLCYSDTRVRTVVSFDLGFSGIG